MRVANKAIKEIVSKLEMLGMVHGTENTFRDWCECMAISIDNSCNLLRGETHDKREQRYMDIQKRYEEKPFPELFALLVNAFEDEPWKDHLGQVYMECFGGNKHLGQCFTPMSVSECCAGLVSVPEPGKESTLYEPSCGGGAMIIAYMKECFFAKYDYQRKLKIEAADLDSLCVHMCYTQLSLLGARAVVKVQNSITLQTFDVFVTPFERMAPLV